MNQQRKGIHLSKAILSNPDNFCNVGQKLLSSMPLAGVCQGIQLLIQELQRRGYQIYDFDDKDKYIQQIQIIQNRVYFMAAGEDDENEKNKEK